MQVEKGTEAYDELKDSLKLLLRETVVTVTFQKESTGKYREMVCTLDPDYLPAEETPKNKKVRTPNPEVCTVFDLERKDWRSFRYDSVVKFKTIEGVYIPRDVRISTVEFIPSED